MPRKIIIIGCGVSGTTAAFYARKTERSAQIILVGEEPLAEYSRCGLPYAFSGVVPTLESILGTNGKVSAVKISGNQYDVDAVVMAVRVAPNTELASKS